LHREAAVGGASDGERQAEQTRPSYDRNYVPSEFSACSRVVARRIVAFDMLPHLLQTNVTRVWKLWSTSVAAIGQQPHLGHRGRKGLSIKVLPR